MGDVHPGRRIGGARPPRHKADTGLAGELALGFGHHGGAALLAAHGHADVGIVQGIQNGQIALAGHAKELLYAMGDELADQNLAAGARGGVWGCGGHVRQSFHKTGTNQNSAVHARWMRAQASCRSAMLAAYEIRK